MIDSKSGSSPRSAVPVRAQFRIRGTSSTRRVGRLHSQPGYDFLLSPSWGQEARSLRTMKAHDEVGRRDRGAADHLAHGVPARAGLRAAQGHGAGELSIREWARDPRLARRPAVVERLSRRLAAIAGERGTQEQLRSACRRRARRRGACPSARGEREPLAGAERCRDGRLRQRSERARRRPAALLVGRRASDRRVGARCLRAPAPNGRGGARAL